MLRPTALLSLTCIIALLAQSLVAQQASPPSARVPLADPAISPDGSTIVFASGGDLWTVPASGGDAHLLVSDPATESRPHWSPDGKRIAFVSNRTGTGDIYVMTLESGDVRRVTWDDAEGYRSLKLGTVVGEPTAGWIIYTSNEPLIDGSVVRLPSWRVTAGDGSQMEMNPRPVDVAVTRALGESAVGRDTQLDAAVMTLLNQIGRRTTTN